MTASGRVLPRRAGIGLKPQHAREILETRPDLGFVEVHAENYMVPGGPMHEDLENIRACYPLSIHGVGLSIGGEGALDTLHLNRLARLVDRYQPESFSEHLAWSSHGGAYLGDLLPLPYTEATLHRVCSHIDEAQTALRRKMLLENPATYLRFTDSSYSESEFLGEVVKRTGCGLLLDVNNLYVSCANHGVDPHIALLAMPLDAVGQIHLAGHNQTTDAEGQTLLIDSHDTPIAESVWALFSAALDQTGAQPTLLEHDRDIPPLAFLLSQAKRAELQLRLRSRLSFDSVSELSA